MRPELNHETSAPDSLRGVVSGIIYRHSDSGWSVIELRSEGELQTVVGCLPELSAGEHCSFTGQWTEHAQYGRQFRAQHCNIDAPTDLLGIERYLGSGLIKGVGPSTARRMVAAFGKDTLEILGEQPDRLKEISGIGKKRARMIAESYAEQYQLRRTMIFLQTYGLSIALSGKISKKYENRAEELIRADPYRLIEDIDGVGFKTADKIALSLGFPRDGERRLSAGIKHLLQEYTFQQGHTYVPRELLIKKAADLLSAPAELLDHCLNTLLMQGELILETLSEDDIFTPDAYACEKEIAYRLQRLASFSQQMMREHVAGQISAFEQAEGIAFSPTQRDAVLRATQSGLLVITGGPGTGKTTLLNCILHILSEGEDNCLLAAPTGRAAKRMSEATGREAKTIHRLLAFGGEDGHFSRDEDNPLDCSCLVIDEMSMADVYLMRSLLRAITPGTRLILVGDSDQLPSVGPGNVLRDILASAVIPQVCLKEIFRQEDHSMIVLNAHRVNGGEQPVLNSKGGDFFFQKQASAEQTAQTIVQLCAERLPRYLNEDSRNIQVLAPTKKGVAGVMQLNRLLQEALNPRQPNAAEMQQGDNLYRLNDKVIHTRNNYQLRWEQPDGTEGEGVFNGDMGRITDIDLGSNTLAVEYEDRRTVRYEASQLEELDLAYCLSVHKSQGSEFEAVVMPVTGGPPMLMTRNLFYTAITRARRLVTLVGYEEAIASMVHNNYHSRRYTRLCQRLQEMPR